MRCDNCDKYFQYDYISEEDIGSLSITNGCVEHFICTDCWETTMRVQFTVLTCDVKYCDKELEEKAIAPKVLERKGWVEGDVHVNGNINGRISWTLCREHYKELCDWIPNFKKK